MKRWIAREWLILIGIILPLTLAYDVSLYPEYVRWREYALWSEDKLSSVKEEHKHHFDGINEATLSADEWLIVKKEKERVEWDRRIWVENLSNAYRIASENPSPLSKSGAVTAVTWAVEWTAWIYLGLAFVRATIAAFRHVSQGERENSK